MLMYGLKRDNVGLVVEHNIGYGGLTGWNILKPLNSINSVEYYGIKINNTELDQLEDRTNENIIVSFYASKNLLNTYPHLLKKLKQTIKYNINEDDSDKNSNISCFSSIYHKESIIKVIEESNIERSSDTKVEPFKLKYGELSDNIDTSLFPSIVVLIHGGGFVLGDRFTYDILLKRHANVLGDSPNPSVVVFIEYRKSPKWKFPVPLEDIIISMAWLHSNALEFGLNPNKIALIGDSAGGNLVVSSLTSCFDIQQKKQEKSIKFCKWVDSVKYIGLIYPAICQKCVTNSKLQTIKLGFLNWNAMAWFEKQYQSSYIEDHFDWRSQPLLTPSNILKKLPITNIVLINKDILQDEGYLLYEILKKLKVLVSVRIYEGSKIMIVLQDFMESMEVIYLKEEMKLLFGLTKNKLNKINIFQAMKKISYEFGSGIFTRIQ
ncbi:hypothetical protein cand_010330 [Cryptosporidium andersoni]|uniref:Alpha/beta hydrolase fold-3 domain-containing protein n=1 Tax=Cryptosporidium andersoni TaxID=117008 RepID=A0A1J4MI99_9CRYT|nr:hypothetical protein cand_010330 [Cryptosporidium andersoni]